MQIVHEVGELNKGTTASIVTIGNFDGVHLAHQKLLREVGDRARSAGAVSTAVTFDPHPLKILAPKHAPRLLTSLNQKASLIESLGIERLVVLPFTESLARIPPAEFARDVLVKGLRPRAVIVGPNFRFGHRHSGDVKLLTELGEEQGFSVQIFPFLEIRGERVSSTRIRELLSAGRVGVAGRMLGRPYASAGPIVPGLGVGRRKTVPTANLAPENDQLPCRGVYVTRARLGSVLHQSVTNVGTKPTFGEHPMTLETFLLNFHGDIKEREMEIQYLFRLRDEKKFSDPESLKAQIQKDAQRAGHYFRMVGAWVKNPSASAISNSK